MGLLRGFFCFLFVFSEIFTEQMKIVPSDLNSNDGFGYSVSISGNYAIVGNPLHNVFRGNAYIYRFNGTKWVFTQKLFSSDSDGNDYFGITVSIEGRYAAVGAPYKSANRGSAYVFYRNDSDIWVEQKIFVGTSNEELDFFGYSVCISEGNLIVGSYGVGSGATENGAVYIYARNDSEWLLQSYLGGEATNKRFGYSVSISYLDTAFVTAPGDGTGVEETFVFEYNETSQEWYEKERLFAEQGNEYFGYSVSNYGNYVVIGSPTGGLCYVYLRGVNNSWGLSSVLNASDAENSDYFGGAVFIDRTNERIIVGAKDKRGSGAAYVYFKNDTIYDYELKLLPSNWSSGDNFGGAVSIYGNFSLVGAFGDDEVDIDAGAAYFFEMSCVDESKEFPLCINSESSKNVTSNDTISENYNVTNTYNFTYLRWEEYAIKYSIFGEIDEFNKNFTPSKRR